MNEQFWMRLAQTLGVKYRVEDPRHCNLIVPNDLPMFIEFFDSGDGLWVWCCQAIVNDLVDENLDLRELLRLNDDGLMWCYHTLHPFEEGDAERISLNLKYTFATPANDHAFALRLLGKVLLNMNKSAVEVTSNV